MPLPSDLFLSPDLTEEDARAYLQSVGFRDAAAADEHLQRMADDLVAREALGRLAADLLSAVLDSPDPDAAVAAISQYVVSRSGRGMFLDYLREDPRALHVLTYVMGASPRLADILIRTPEYFHWLVAQVERSAPDRQDHEEELVSAFATIDDPIEGLNMLRRWKRRETLRIGTRDLLRHETVQTAGTQLSDVACVAVDFALAIIMQQRLDAEARDKAPGAFAVIGTGSLGGREMSYDDHVELLYVYDVGGFEGSEAGSTHEFFVKVGRDLTAALETETQAGSLYHVELPFWPPADGGVQACSLAEYSAHYAGSGDLSERLSLVRARPIAGNAELGAQFMALCHDFIYREGHRNRNPPKCSGNKRPGGDVEMLTQEFQLAHGAQYPTLRHTGTLGALDAMAKAGLISDRVCHELDHAYVFLRAAEHRRQLGLSTDLDTQVQASQARVREICAKLAGS